MATDDERREVARKLREYVDLPDDWRAETYSVFYVEKCVFGDVERHRESELFARLAELIEPSCDASATNTDATATRDVSQCRRSDVDRDALLALADEMENVRSGYTAKAWFTFNARRIREALGMDDGR